MRKHDPANYFARATPFSILRHRSRSKSRMTTSKLNCLQIALSAQIFSPAERSTNGFANPQSSRFPLRRMFHLREGPFG